jgi:hypothetical protein
MTSITQDITDDTLLTASGVTLEALLASPVTSEATIRFICVLRKHFGEAGMAAADVEDIQLDAAINSIYHTLGKETRNRAFTTSAKPGPQASEQ